MQAVLMNINNKTTLYTDICNSIKFSDALNDLSRAVLVVWIAEMDNDTQFINIMRTTAV